MSSIPCAEYFKLIDRCASERKDLEISNAKPEHARYLIKKLFSIASRNVRLYTGRLDQKSDRSAGLLIYAWDDLIREVISFLSLKDARLDILVQKEIDGDKEHPLIQEIRNKGLFGKVNIKQVNRTDPFADTPTHFMTVDASAFRLETDDERTEAVANFWNPRLTKRLNSVFDNNFSLGKSLSFSS